MKKKDKLDLSIYLTHYFTSKIIITFFHTFSYFKTNHCY